MLRDIQSNLFLFYCDAERSKYFYNSHADERSNNSHSDGDDDTDELGGKEMKITEYQTVPLGNAVDRGLTEQTCRDAAPDTADAVTSKGVERVINFQFLFHKSYAKVADRTYQKTDDK